jgi:hypothetical protein
MFRLIAKSLRIRNRPQYTIEAFETPCTFLPQTFLNCICEQVTRNLSEGGAADAVRAKANHQRDLRSMLLDLLCYQYCINTLITILASPALILCSEELPENPRYPNPQGGQSSCFGDWCELATTSSKGRAAVIYTRTIAAARDERP